MNYVHKKAKMVMALFPERKGFGFAIFKGSFTPMDWGSKSVVQGNKNYQCLKKIAALFLWYAPDVVVIEDHRGAGSHKSKRVQALLRRIAVLARMKRIEVVRYSRKEIRTCFEEMGAMTKHQIAQAIAQYLPMFRDRLPRKRKLWTSEDDRMKVFDAISLVFTYYYFNDEALRVG